jgi:DNA-binding GntR family transcriptional regulator
VRTAIFDGSLAAGAHLGEIELSEGLGVSRATLREAFRQLHQEGLLTQDGRGRLMVREVSADEVRDIFEVRLGLEQIAVRRLCERADRATDVTALRRLLEPLRTETDLAAGLAADLDFHHALCSLAGNPALERTWSSLSGVIRITMIAAGSAPARDNLAYERHAPIVDLIETGDAASATIFLAEHMSTAADTLIARM